MESEYCRMFIVGFCPNEEFSIEGFTKKCPLLHASAEKERYSKENRISDFEYGVLEQYKEILDDVEKKIEHNNRILKKETVGKEHYMALCECEKIIESKTIEDFNFEKMHTLLLLHGKLINDHKESVKKHSIAVCPNCSAFFEVPGMCSHKFCKKYEKLRKITEMLQKKLPRKPSSE